MMDRSAKGRSGQREQRGEANARCRLSEKDIAEILAMRRAGTEGLVIAERFGVSRKYVYAICNGRVRRPDGLVLRVR
jgi:hypothetical protein